MRLVIIYILSSVLLSAATEMPIVAKQKADLEKIIIPKVAIKSKTLGDSIDFAWARAVELDGNAKMAKLRGVTIIVQFPCGNTYPRTQNESHNDHDCVDVLSKKINYISHNVSLVSLLVEVAKQANLSLYNTSVGIVFCPRKNPPFPNILAHEGEIWDELHVSENSISGDTQTVPPSDENPLHSEE